MKSRSERTTRKYKAVAMRAPETNHKWRLTGEYLRVADSEGWSEIRRSTFIANAVRLAEKDAIWLFHYRVGENHFELWAAPRKMRVLPI